jgi:H+-translocating NAD(P) transhydrogenase
VTLSAVNLAGGTIVTKKMLDMFRRKDDAPEYNEYYLMPGLAAGESVLCATAILPYYEISSTVQSNDALHNPPSVAGSGALFATGLAPASLAPMLAMGSALGCVGGIACLSSQETARLGIYVGMSGIGTGLASTLAYMSPDSIQTYGQLMLMGGSGAGAGYYISTKIGPTELPQAVAAFHSLVGLAATFTAVGDFMGESFTT